MIEVIFPDLCKLGRFFFAQEREKFFYCHICGMFQRIGRAVGFQASTVSTITEWTIRIDAHVFQSSTVHGTALVDQMICDDCTAQISVQQKDDCAVKFRMIP